VKGAVARMNVLMSGGSRGIGLAIALRLAREGASVTFLAKTASPHPKLPGTVHTAVAEVDQAGGRGLAVVGDVRSDADVERAVAAAVDTFGGIDVLVNNASAIDLSKTTELSMKRYDLMQDVNCRGTFALSRAAVPYLRRADNPHILTLSPPMSMTPRWVGAHLGYTLSKYGMSLCTLGLSAELAGDGIGVNSLWPRTMIATAAVGNLLGGAGMMARSRSPQIMADAAHAIICRAARSCTGNFFIDDEVLADEGVTDFGSYAPGDTAHLELDLFIDAPPASQAR
jgi:citronellol/citronellal dehydrogenase